jgi:hypothetical protein
VFIVIVGTGNHYVFDCAVGTLTFALAAATAFLIHRGERPVAAVRIPRTAVPTILGFTMIAYGVESLEAVGLADWRSVFPDGVVLIVGIAAVVAPRLSERRRRQERHLRSAPEAEVQPVR